MDASKGRIGKFLQNKATAKIWANTMTCSYGGQVRVESIALPGLYRRDKHVQPLARGRAACRRHEGLDVLEGGAVVSRGLMDAIGMARALVSPVPLSRSAIGRNPAVAPGEGLARLQPVRTFRRNKATAAASAVGVPRSMAIEWRQCRADLFHGTDQGNSLFGQGRAGLRSAIPGRRSRISRSLSSGRPKPGPGGSIRATAAAVATPTSASPHRPRCRRPRCGSGSCPASSRAH